ncbi:hypothetical protein B0T17DRAFT_512557 [Bombardia bombarda]|uniref:Uncharacterized protein n=1 Tax=Bombardia bombarda TaxID=252184 RepID=A0AA39TQU6_9PEZI|nr:hypothetical protein B0T17DRAFT_512557 [Bombardia bombarda]
MRTRYFGKKYHARGMDVYGSKPANQAASPLHSECTFAQPAHATPGLELTAELSSTHNKYQSAVKVKTCETQGSIGHTTTWTGNFICWFRYHKFYGACTSHMPRRNLNSKNSVPDLSSLQLPASPEKQQAKADVNRQKHMDANPGWSVQS